MNVFILTDLEGVAKIDSISQMEREGAEYEISRNHLTESLNLAIDTCVKNGAEKVYYLDGHAGGGNVFEQAVDKRAEKCSIDKWQELLRDGKVDCQMEIGSHAKAGTLGGFLDHTLSSKSIFYIKINGVEMSELSLHAILCGKYNVPVVAVTGDEASCNQAKEFIPDICAGVVKKAVKRNEAITIENADEILVETIEKALKNYKNISVFKVSEPAEIEVCYYRSDMCDEIYEKHRDVANRKDARTITKTVEKIVKYDDLKF